MPTHIPSKRYNEDLSKSVDVEFVDRFRGLSWSVRFVYRCHLWNDSELPWQKNSLMLQRIMRIQLHFSTSSKLLIILKASIRSPLLRLVSKVVRLNSFNLSLYYLFAKPSMILVALFWTFSSNSISFLRNELQA